MNAQGFDDLPRSFADRRRAILAGMLALASGGVTAVGVDGKKREKKKKAKLRAKLRRRAGRRSVKNCRADTPLDWGPEWPSTCGQVRSRCCPTFAKASYVAYCKCLRDLGCATCEHGPNSITVVPLTGDLTFSGSSDEVIGPLRLDAGQYRVSVRYRGDDSLSVIARWSNGSDDLTLFDGTGDYESYVDFLFDYPVTVVLEVTGVGEWELRVEKRV